MRLCIFIIVSMLLALVACKHENSGALRQARENIGSQRQQLVYRYLAGDVVQARDSLQQSVKLIEGETVLSPIAHTPFLNLGYCRLYALEKRVGNEAAASAYLEKAREWHLKSMESANLPTDRMNESIKSYTAEYVIWEADDADKGENNNNLPKYVQNIP